MDENVTESAGRGDGTGKASLKSKYDVVLIQTSVSLIKMHCTEDLNIAYECIILWNVVTLTELDYYDIRRKDKFSCDIVQTGTFSMKFIQ